MFKSLVNKFRGRSKRDRAIETAQETALHFLGSAFAPEFFEGLSADDIEELYLRIKFGTMYLDENNELHYEESAARVPVQVGDDFRVITGPFEDNRRMSLIAGTITGETDSDWLVDVRYNIQEGKQADTDITSIPKRFHLLNFTRINEHQRAIERSRNQAEMHRITQALASGNLEELDITVSPDGRSTQINLK